MKNQARSSTPKWAGRLEKYADGGEVEKGVERGEFPEPYAHKHRENAVIKTEIPAETNDRAIIHPDDLKDWKIDFATNKI